MQNKELEWAHVYHDSIRGCPWLESLPLNVGRWAGTYALFYILNRILRDYRPSSIVETGLGESTKFISTFLEHELKDSRHVAIEQSADWKDAFQQRFQLSDRVTIDVCELTEKKVKGHTYNCYDGIEKFSDRKFDLYLIDGPLGSDHYSRYDMVQLAQPLTSDDEFIFLIDDMERPGEKESVSDLLELFEKKGIKVHKGTYSGNATLLAVCTEKYRYATTL